MGKQETSRQYIARRNREYKNLGGRPSKMTPEVVSKLIAAFHNDFTVELACSYSGITKDTYYQWLKKYQWFSDEMSNAQGYVDKKAREVLISDIQAGDSEAARWWLKHRRSKEFNTQQNLANPDGTPLDWFSKLAKVAQSNGNSNRSGNTGAGTDNSDS